MSEKKEEEKNHSYKLKDKRKTIRVPPDLYEKIERIAKEHFSGITLPEAIDFAITYCEKYKFWERNWEKNIVQQYVKTQAARVIMFPNKFESHCQLCNHIMHEGQMIYMASYPDGSNLYYCMECSISRMGDKALVKKDQRLYEIRKLVSIYEKELEPLRQEYLKYNIIDMLNELLKKVTFEDNRLRDFYNEIGKYSEEELAKAILAFSEVWKGINESFKKICEKLGLIIKRKPTSKDREQQYAV